MRLEFSDMAEHMAIKKDYSVDVVRLIEKLTEELHNAKAMGRMAIFVDRDNLVMQLRKISASMPKEIKDAANVARESEKVLDKAKSEAEMSLDQAKRESDRMLSEAKRESERMVEQARLQQEAMINDSEILKLSKAQSEEIRSQAERDARAMRIGAEEYAYEIMNKLENSVGRVLAAVERGKSELEAASDGDLGRERVRV
jgi:cell division septum initiation protein DivIVA